MPAIFPRSIDARVRQAAVGFVVAVGLFAIGWYYYALPSYTRVGYQPEQPVPFSHEQHVGQLGLDCRYCHQAVFESPQATVPTSQTCMNCHDPRKANVKGDSPLLAPVRDSYYTGQPVEWKRVHKLPEYAYFNHAVHVNKGVSCVECHGKVNEMKIVRHDQPLSMGWCLKCHDNPTASLRPVGEVTNLNWAPSEGQSREDIGREIQKELRVDAPNNCQSCHR
jgi:formate-dependent nitrite reductase cytochrome c552 subunit